MTPSLGLGRHLEQWLRTFVLATISNSPADCIRACTTLVTSRYPLAMKIFTPAFLSCWNQMKEKGRQRITKSFREWINAQENYEAVAREILNLLVFMHKIEQPIGIPPGELVKSCLRYGSIALALRLQEDMLGKSS
jgi:hypothetical protein